MKLLVALLLVVLLALAAFLLGARPGHRGAVVLPTADVSTGSPSSLELPSVDVAAPKQIAVERTSAQPELEPDAALFATLSGTVVDDAGQPIGGASVVLKRPRPEGGGVLGPQAVAGAVCDEVGRFVITEVALERDDFLDARALEHVASGHLALRGRTSGLKVVLKRRKGEIRGRVLIEDGLRDSRLWVLAVKSERLPELRVQDLRAEVEKLVVRGRAGATTVNAQGGFCIPKLVAEELYEVVCAYEADDGWAILLSIEGVNASAAGGATDPRLAELDLRGRIQVLEFNILDGRRAPIERGEYRLGASTRRHGFDAARIGLRVQRLPIELEIASQGFQPGHWSGLDAGGELVLERMLEVQVRLKGTGAEPVLIHLNRIEEPSEKPRVEAAWGITSGYEVVAPVSAIRKGPVLSRVGGGEPVTFWIAQTGRYSVEVSPFVDGVANFGGPAGSSSLENPTITVVDQPVQSFEVQVDPERFRARLERLRMR